MSTYVWISRQRLIDAGACREGLALFDALKSAQDERRSARGLRPRALLRLEWSTLAYLWLESEGRRFASWMFHCGIVPMPSFARANLGGANLGGANLGGAYLGGANLDGAYLGDWERGPDGYARRKA